MAVRFPVMAIMAITMVIMMAIMMAVMAIMMAMMAIMAIIAINGYDFFLATYIPYRTNDLIQLRCPHPAQQG